MKTIKDKDTKLFKDNQKIIRNNLINGNWEQRNEYKK